MLAQTGPETGLATEGDVASRQRAELAAQRAAVRTRLADGPATQALDRLAVEDPELAVYLDPRAAPGERPTILSGRDLASACRPSTPLRPHDALWLTSQLDCALPRLAPLLSQNGDRVDLEDLVLERHGPGMVPGEWQAVWSQHHAGVPVEGAGLRLFYIGERLVSVSGRVWDGRRFPARGGARATVPPEAEGVSTVFSPERGAFVTRYHLDGRRIELHEDTGARLSEGPAGHFFVPSTTSIQVRAYDYSQTLYPTNLWSATLAPMTATRYCETSACAPSEICRFYMARHDVPGNDGRSSRTLIGLGPWESDVFRDYGCAVEPFDDLNFPDQEFFAGNLATQANRMAGLLEGWWSYFYYARAHEPLEVKAQTSAPGPGVLGEYTGFDNRINIWQDAGSNQNHAASLAVIAHEYGHYIHEMYDPGYVAAKASTEGWADTLPYRYVMQQHHLGQWPGLHYGSNLYGSLRPYRHGWSIDAGQLRPSPAGPSFRGQSPECVDENANPYDCGGLLSQIYWELAWNHCRAPYDTCGVDGVDDQILRSGPYLGIPWALLNSAYAYAIANLPSGAGIEAFFELVIARYRQFRVDYDFLSWADYGRVGAVLSHHCVGWSDHCWGEPGYHYLPGATALPAKFTRRAESFTEAETAFAPVVSTPWASGEAYAVLAPLGDVTIPVAVSSTPAACYRLRLIARAGTGTGTGTSLDLWIDGVYQGAWTVTAPAGSWHAVEHPLNLQLAAGGHTVRLRERYYRALDVDAASLQSCP